MTKWLVGHRFPAADQVALAVTDVFGPAETAGAAILLGVVTALKFRSYLSGLVVIVTVGGVSALCAPTGGPRRAHPQASNGVEGIGAAQYRRRCRACAVVVAVFVPASKMPLTRR